MARPVTPPENRWRRPALPGLLLDRSWAAPGPLAGRIGAAAPLAAIIVAFGLTVLSLAAAAAWAWTF
ncbi:MAG: hypothetical protein HYY13_05965 [Nitrospirae bacterium]|nr:hypothetical protein [Nitrospirota bacterium]